MNQRATPPAFGHQRDRDEGSHGAHAWDVMALLTMLINVLIGLAFLVPIIIAPNHSIYPVIVPKVLVFRGAVELMVGAYMILALGR